MKTDSKPASSIDEYIAGFPIDVQKILIKLRGIVKKAAPEAEEAIKYQIPTFVLYGNLVHFAAFQNHIGFYPTPSGIEHFKDELSKYKGAKGSVQFPLDGAIPYSLITKIVSFRVKEVREKAASKVRKKQLQQLSVKSNLIMHPLLRNVLAVVAGVVIGSVVNMTLINVGSIVVPLPEGADLSTMEGLRDSMKLFTPANFLFPFLAHALGTLSGAFVAAKLAASRPMTFAISIGAFFLFGGVMMILLVGGPIWFKLADLFLAYFPMAYVGGILASGTGPKKG